MPPQHTHRTNPSTFEVDAAEATWAARWDWQRLAGRASADRIALVTDQVWQRGYALAYRDAYSTVTQRVVAAATRGAVDNAEARPTLARLAAAALAADDQAQTRPLLAPPADPRTLAAATHLADSDAHQPWKPVAHTAWTGSLSAGTIAGTLAAATDTVIGWRARGGHHLADEATVHGRPAPAWIADLLAGINHHTVSTGPGGPGGGPTAARLARQDHAAGTAGPSAAPVAGRRPDPAPGPTTASHARSR
jgi:hypothetical protein